MNDKAKGELIGKIITELKLAAGERQFDEGDTFFSLAFKTDDDLLHIANLCGISA